MSCSGDVSPSLTPSTTPALASHAPKYGTVIPNRIFVGGIVANTTEQELKQFFSSYGAVKDTKIIADRAGVSKGRYGFVTFETQEDAERIIKKESENLMFKDRKLNIGPAIRKQQFPAVYDASLSPGPVMLANGVPYTFQNGMAIFSPPEPVTLPASPALAAQPSAYPTMMALPQASQQMYLPQAYAAYHTTPAAATIQASQYSFAQPQLRWATQGAAATGVSPASQYIYPGMLDPSMTAMYAASQQHAYSAAQELTTQDPAQTLALEAGAPAEKISSGVEQQSGSQLSEPSPSHSPRPVSDRILAEQKAASLQVYASTGMTPVLDTSTMFYTHPAMVPPSHAQYMTPAMVRTPGVAYKRPLQTMQTPYTGYAGLLTPRTTPPAAKYLIGPGQCLVPKMGEYAEYVDAAHVTPLSPPATPDVTGLRG